MKHLIRTILLIINLAVAVCLPVSAYGGMVNSTVSAIPGLALMVFPLVLGAAVVMILIDLVLWRRLAFLPLLTVLACAPGVWNYCPLNISRPHVQPGQRTFTLMTYNVYNLTYCLDPSSRPEVSPTLSVILAEDADIVCLQEGLMVDPSQWRVHRSQADSITARYPYRAIGRGSLEVWSKYPLDSIATPSLGDPTAMMQCVRVNIGSLKIHLYNVHLQSIGLSSADKELYDRLTRRPTTGGIEEARYDLLGKVASAMRERSRQGGEIRALIDSLPAGSCVMVAGDFNDIEGCRAQRLISGRDLKSTFTAVGCGPAVTYNANRLYFNIDHILYSAPLKAVDYRCVKIRASDHYPVIGTYLCDK